MTWVRFIPLLPLVAALVHGLMIGVFRRNLPTRLAGAITVGSVACSLIFSVFAFAELIGRAPNDAIVDRVATWIGLGIGPSALVVDLALRFDPLSAVMCLLISGVGVITLVYSIGDLQSDTREDRGEQRFFAFASLLLAAMLLLVLAEGFVLLIAAWSAVGVATWWMLGFWYRDDARVRAATLGFVLGRVGDAALIGAFAVTFWTLADAGRFESGFGVLRQAAPVLAAAALDWPALLGGGRVPVSEVACCLVLVAIVTRAGQLPLTGWLGEAIGAPVSALVLVHTVTTVAAPIYLATRLAFLFAEAPIASAAAAWIGATTALVGALVACAQIDVLRVLAWSTASQLGFALVAIGVGAPTASIFQLIAHAFHKGLILMAMGVVVAAIGLERDLWRMGNLGSRLWRTRIDVWIAVLSIAAVLPISTGFFALEQIVVAAGLHAALPGHFALMALLLLAATATAFHVVRLLALSLYGDTRIPSTVRWDELEDPGPLLLWPMGLLAALTLGGALIGMPQMWADLLFSSIEDANSLHHFLAPAVLAADPVLQTPAEAWSYAGLAALMGLLGAGSAFFLYLYRPRWVGAITARVGWLHRGLLRGMDLEPALHRLLVAPVLGFADRWLARGVEDRLVEGVTLRGSARIVQALAGGWLRSAQSGSAMLYIVTTLAAGLGLLVFLLQASPG